MNTNFIINKTYIVNGIGMVISGVLKSGTVKKGDILYIGPNSNGFLRDDNNVIIDKTKLTNKMITKIVTKIENKTNQNDSKTHPTNTKDTDYTNYYKVSYKKYT